MNRAPARHATRAAVLLATVCYLMLLGVAAASAHAVLGSSSPGDGSMPPLPPAHRTRV